MDFDFRHLTTPFRMQPGLARLPSDATPLLTPLVPGSALWEEKNLTWRAGQSRHCMSGFNPQAALAAIARHAPQQTVVEPLELAFEEDFAVLDGASTIVPWMCVCNPSRWAPEEKIGLSFAQIHSPVPDSGALVSATRALVRLVTDGGQWERWVWTISPSDRYDQHPVRTPQTAWPTTADPLRFAQGCWFRAERQVFFPVCPESQQAVFAIRVMRHPLPQIVQTPSDADRLYSALNSMTDATLAYKGLTTARPLLLAWLKERANGHVL